MEATDQRKVFQEWLESYRALIFKVVLSYALKPCDQEDLFQEITIQLWNSIPRFRAESAVTTWIYRVALNTAIAWSRKEKKHRKVQNAEALGEGVLVDQPEFTDERLIWLYEKINQLNEIDRSLTLLMLDGYSYREMAEIMGISESNVGVKINRIKKHLIAEKGERKAS